MSTSYSVVMRVRHRFGDKKKDGNDPIIDSAAPFVGLAHEFPFACPDVDAAEEAILQFEYRGSMQKLTFPDPQPDGGFEGITEEHPVKVNGQLLAGGVPGAPVRNRTPLWGTRVLLIRAGVLRENNVLRIESSAFGPPSNRNFDDFTIDNAVVYFKSRSSPGLSTARS
jgi:hypothetical protein